MGFNHHLLSWPSSDAWYYWLPPWNPFLLDFRGSFLPVLSFPLIYSSVFVSFLSCILLFYPSYKCGCYLWFCPWVSFSLLFILIASTSICIIMSLFLNFYAHMCLISRLVQLTNLLGIIIGFPTSHLKINRTKPSYAFIFMIPFHWSYSVIQNKSCDSYPGISFSFLLYTSLVNKSNKFYSPLFFHQIVFPPHCYP